MNYPDFGSNSNPELIAFFESETIEEANKKLIDFIGSLDFFIDPIFVTNISKKNSNMIVFKYKKH